MSEWKILKSTQDASVNFIKGEHGKYLEARYVRRTEEKVAVYLSSQYGCNQSCRMCHLTATGQTDNTQATLEDYLEQAEIVLEYYSRNQPKARRANFCLMARGEPLLNPVILEEYKELYVGLYNLAKKFDLDCKVVISTIMPKSLEYRDFRNFCVNSKNTNTLVYYSMYSISAVFRKRWLPKAMVVYHALNWLGTNKVPTVLHWCFIQDENDTVADIQDICEAATTYKVAPIGVNIVRFNPPANSNSKEPPEERIKHLAWLLGELLPGTRIKIVDRVGFDVHASCGTFIPKE